MEVNPILCFQHCEAGERIYCLVIPAVCPQCCSNLSNCLMRIPPFRIPTPFVNSKEYPYGVALRPTTGSFLENYQNEFNLHIGITDSEGVVYDFDVNGINRSLVGWKQCLVVYSLDSEDIYRRSLWNTRLQEFTAYERWTKEKYCEKTRNCYDFVLEFLLLMNLDGVVNDAGGDGSNKRTNFCKNYVMRHTARAAKYISLYRRLRREGTIVQYSTVL